MTALIADPPISPGQGGLRRNQLIDPRPGLVSAEVEDDYHRFLVELAHDGERITAVRTESRRAPWTTCPSAGDHLVANLTGALLAEVDGHENPLTHCTHMLDLAILAAAHAGDTAPTVYSMFIADPYWEPRLAVLNRDGEEVLRWTVDGSRLVAPGMMVGRDLRALRHWGSEIAPALREPVRVLRRGVFISRGRGFDHTALTTAAAVAGGKVACYTFSTEHGADARHYGDSIRSFDGRGTRPLADRLSP